MRVSNRASRQIIQDSVPRRVNAARTTRDKLNCTSGSCFTTSASRSSLIYCNANARARVPEIIKRRACERSPRCGYLTCSKSPADHPRGRLDPERGSRPKGSRMMSARSRYAEAAEFLRGKVSEARALLGPRDKLTLTFREMRCMNIVWDPEANAAAVRGILPELEDLCRVTRQVYGATHPGFLMCQNYLKCARGRLAGQPCMTKRGGTYTLIPAVRE